MKNDWLERKGKRVANRQTMLNLDKLVKEWQETGNNADKIVTIMRVLAHEVIDYLKPDMQNENRCNAHEDMVCACISRLNKLDTNRSHAFNYFTTVMLCILRQHTMNVRDFNKAKEEFREYVTSQRGRNRNKRKA